MSTINWGALVAEAGDSGKTFEPLPDGDYNFKIIEAPVQIASTGATMWKVKAEVIDGSYARRLVWDNLVVNAEKPSSLGFFFRKMDAIGLGQEYFNQNPTNDQIAAALKGRTFRATVGQKTYQGKVSNEIKVYHKAPAQAAPAGYAPAPMAAPAPVAAPLPPAPAAPVAPPVSYPAPAAAPAPQPVAAPAPQPVNLPAPPF